MDQRKIGLFLKQLRKDHSLTQEQLAAQFHVSFRTVSRWETGSNMPDISTLIALADFYDVDIREIIDGEKHPHNQDSKHRDTLNKVATYARETERGTRTKLLYLMFGSCVALLICTLLFSNGAKGLLYGVIPEGICDQIRMLVYIICASMLIFCLRTYFWQEKPAEEPEQSVAAAVVSKEIKSETHESGRSKGGYSYTVKFLTEDGRELELFTYEIEYGGLREVSKGILTYKGRYFVDFL